MKKLLIILLTAMLTLVCFAEGDIYATAGDLFQSWAGSYPDYICGVWSTDGGMRNLTFSVVNSEEGEKGKAEILALVEDDTTVTFEYGAVSRNYLLNVQEELLPYFEKGLGLSYSGVYEMENRIGLGILTDMKDDPDTLAMLEELEEKYGDVFFVEYTSGINTYNATLDPPVVSVQKESNAIWYIVFGTVAVALTAALVIFLRKTHTLIKATNAGSVTEEALSVKDVEAEIKNAECVVSSELDERVMKDINK